jgi:hypothetical protein
MAMRYQVLPLASFDRSHITFSLPCREKTGRIRRMEHWQIIADKLRNAEFSCGCSSKNDSTGRWRFSPQIACAPMAAALLSGRRQTSSIADHLSKRGWRSGCVSAMDCEGRTRSLFRKLRFPRFHYGFITPLEKGSLRTLARPKLE